MANIDDFIAIVLNLDSKPPSSLGKTAPSFDVSKPENWMNQNPQDPRNSTRTIAYLAGYLSIAEGDFFSAKGIELNDRKLHLDKNVMSDLLHADFVSLSNGVFSLTVIGQTYLTSIGILETNMGNRKRGKIDSWEQYRDILKDLGPELMFEYHALAKMGVEKYIDDRGLASGNKSKTYFFNLDGTYIDMKAPVRVVLADIDKPRSFQSRDIYKALLDLGYNVVHDPSATGGAPLDGHADNREAPRYMVLARPQQSKFRRSISTLFNHKCWITDCEIAPALEAAHITPYSQSTDDPQGDHASNGLLLRRDLHALFDAGLLLFKPDGTQGSYIVCIKKAARYGDYSKLHGQTLTYPESADAKPAQNRLKRRYENT